MAFHPYLAFTGNCREAFTRYQEIFGGESGSSSGPPVLTTKVSERSRHP